MIMRALFCTYTLVIVSLLTVPACARQQASPASLTPPSSASLVPGIHHYEYVLPDGAICVYDADNGFALIDSVAVPTTAGTRGLSVSPTDAKLYLSYRGDGGFRGNGSLMQFDLVADSVRWTKSYNHGVDSHDMSADGKTIYMPDGELTADGKWYVVDARTGNETGATINTGVQGPHNTIVSRDGSLVFLGDRDPNNTGDPNNGHHVYFYAARTSNDSIVSRVGPVLRGVRPFTVNGRGTIAFLTITGLLGFQVGSVTTGQVLYTVDLTTAGFPISPCIGDGFTGGNCQTSHGISLSPDETELYVIDSPNSIVHVFDVSGVERGIAPKRIFDIHLNHRLLGQATSCAYDCLQIGWLQHSIDGRFVYVGDCGDVISTESHSIVGYIPALRNTRKCVEIDWVNGLPVATSTRQGIGALMAMTVPPSPALIVPVDLAPNQPRSLTFRWRRSGPPVRYQLELSTDSLFATIALNDTSVVDTSRKVDSLIAGQNYYWRVRSYNAAGKSAWTPVRRLTIAPANGLEISYGSGWNLLSLPAPADDPRTSALFPLAISGVFSYNGAYVAVDSMRPGVGYWVGLSADQPVSYSKPFIAAETVAVIAGWNLIGGPGTVVRVSSIASSPPGIATSHFFLFSHGTYATADSLVPGSGYWVKTDAGGSLFLRGGANAAAGSSIRTVLNESPPSPPGGVAGAGRMPREYMLAQNYPNPFNPTTRIEYALPAEGYVRLTVMNLLGQEVSTLVDRVETAGYKAVEFDAGRLPSGVYFYRLTAGVFSAMRKLLLVK